MKFLVWLHAKCHVGHTYTEVFVIYWNFSLDLIFVYFVWHSDEGLSTQTLKRQKTCHESWAGTYAGTIYLFNKHLLHTLYSGVSVQQGQHVYKVLNIILHQGRVCNFNSENYLF